MGHQIRVLKKIDLGLTLESAEGNGTLLLQIIKKNVFKSRWNIFLKGIISLVT